jgi:hypothetical protein
MKPRIPAATKLKGGLQMPKRMSDSKLVYLFFGIISVLAAIVFFITEGQMKDEEMAARELSLGILRVGSILFLFTGIFLINQSRKPERTT